MEKDTNKLNMKKYYLPLALIVMAGFIFLYNPMPRIQQGPASNLPLVQPVPALYRSSEKDILGEKTYLEIEISLVKNMNLTRDPFFGYVQQAKAVPIGGKNVNMGITEAPAPKLNLQGIWDSDDQKIAFINGKMVKVNDSVDGCKVLRITDNDVLLSRNGQTYLLKLGS
ncbi:MAG: hypothetical protein WC838_00285 [Candidatus Margulisiibacteriota bacterium]|jgi:hypothetical protein